MKQAIMSLAGKGAQSKSERALSLRERHRLNLVFVANIVLILMPLEGVLRKWVLNFAEKPLLFVRDPLMVYLFIGYIFLYGFDKYVVGYLIVLYTVSAVAFIQVFFLDAPLVAVIIGLRNYFLFAPLFFILPKILSSDDLRRWVVQWLWLAIPIGLLVIAQFYSPVSSVLNKGLDDNVEGRFTVVKDIVRPYGPFTFVLGQNFFSAILLSIWISAFSNRKRFNISLLIMFASGACVFSMGALSGGRTYFVLAGSVAFFYFLSGFLDKSFSRGIWKIAGALVACILFLFTFIFVFTSSFEAMTERQEAAVASEGSTSGRALGIMSEMFEVLPEAPFLGYGIGVGTNAGGYAATGSLAFQLAENEWTRIVLELGPLFGILVILARCVFCVFLFSVSLKSLRSSGNAAGMIMLGSTLPLLLTAQISGNNQLVTMGWAAAGLCWALAIRIPRVPMRMAT